MKQLAYELSPVRLPRRDLVLPGHGEVDGVDEHAIACVIRRGLLLVGLLQ